MKQTAWEVCGISIPVISLDVAVIGSGCAGFNAVDWLWNLNRRDIALITEGVNMGTSRNTGSDKQTYYKLSLASDGEDSIAKMAKDLFAGEGVNGDTALAEAANSVRCFIKLANLGVPFPTNEYGEYVGYKTDHDPRQRATSAGPLTSRYMTECLEKAVREKGVPILDGFSAVKLLVKNGEMEGLLCLDHKVLSTPSCGLTILRAKQVILATGGPAGCYDSRVYPQSQTGMSGMALEAGAKGANLQEWQYGLASIKFRWNVSGTYQQVLPRYISVDKEGVEREFLADYFEDPQKALDMVFLKGYQWPFDSTKITGSSRIDMIVHHEMFDLGRRVYMDFRKDPMGLENGFDGLGDETYRYLKSSGALLKTPIARLLHMNPLAIELYWDHQIDLCTEPLEVSVCAQHHNGGLWVDSHWQTNIRGLYAAGEAAGTFGVHRPGGSALNATQVGSLRAAEQIVYTTKPDMDLSDGFVTLAKDNAASLLRQLNRVLESASPGSGSLHQRKDAQASMSLWAAHIRTPEKMRELRRKLQKSLDFFFETAQIEGPEELPWLLKNRDIFLTQSAVLSAMIRAAEVCGTRGSALVLSPEGVLVDEKLPGFSYLSNRPLASNLQLITEKTEQGFASEYCPVRSLPDPDGWFENVWKAYRERTKNHAL